MKIWAVKVILDLMVSRFESIIFFFHDDKYVSEKGQMSLERGVNSY